MERATGIDPAYSAWEADVLPLNYARENKKPGFWNRAGGAGDVTWTHDLLITNQLHYRLCYTSVFLKSELNFITYFYICQLFFEKTGF